MFNKKVIESDDFLMLPKGAQCLYIHLSMHADDEGFINNARSVMALCDCSQEDMQELIATGYILQVTPAIYAVAHWHVNNNVPKDRYHSTIIVDWKRYLELDNGIYKPKGVIR